MICLAPLTASGEPRKVGDFGDPERLIIQGVQTFSGKEVRNSLWQDFDVLLAAHPAAPFPDYIGTLRQRCLDGFHNEGFVQAKVSVHLDDRREQIAITVEEGPRLLAGQLRVVGGRRIDAERLAKMLQRDGPLRRKPLRAQQPEEDEEHEGAAVEGPLWEPGEPASFHEGAADRRQRIIATALAEIGFPHCRFECELVPNLHRKKTDLRIRILDEGPAAVVHDVEVTGSKNNTHDAVLKAIQWRKGALVTASDLTEMNSRLHRSGRFIKHDVELLPPEGDREQFRLRVAVMEYPHAPPLGEPLTDVERVLHRSSVWWSKFENHGLDLVFQYTHTLGRFRVIFSPQEGVLTLWRPPKTEKADSDEHALVIASDELGYYYAGLDQFLSVRGQTFQVTVSSKLGLTEEQNPDKPFRIKFGLKFRNSRDDGAPPVVVDFDPAPVYFFALAHAHDARCHFQDDTLVIDSEIEHLELDVATGRPKKMVFGKTSPQKHARVTFEADAMRRQRRRLQRQFPNSTNALDSQRPITSFCRFLLTEPPVIDPDGRLVIKKLLDQGLLRPVALTLT